MSDLYLVAHKVRGQPAFDVAIQMECPECIAQGCNECDDLGYWWIIPTSGHRAYPYWSISLESIGSSDNTGEFEPLRWLYPDMPDHCVDHYLDHGTAPKIDLISALGLKPRPPAKFERRI